MGTKPAVFLTKVRSSTFWFWSEVIQHLYSNTETKHVLMFQFVGFLFTNSKTTYLTLFESCLWEIEWTWPKAVSHMEKVCFNISIFPCGVWRNEIVPGSAKAACSPVGMSLPFQDFQKKLSQRRNVLLFADFCMTTSLHSPLRSSNFSGTKWLFQAPKKKS